MPRPAPPDDRAPGRGSVHDGAPDCGVLVALEIGSGARPPPTTERGGPRAACAGGARRPRSRLHPETSFCQGTARWSRERTDRGDPLRGASAPPLAPAARPKRDGDPFRVRGDRCEPAEADQRAKRGDRRPWSQRRDSNPQPPDYKSGALPIEPRWQRTAPRGRGGSWTPEGSLGTGVPCGVVLLGAVRGRVGRAPADASLRASTWAIRGRLAKADPGHRGLLPTVPNRRAGEWERRGYCRRPPMQWSGGKNPGTAPCTASRWRAGRASAGHQRRA